MILICNVCEKHFNSDRSSRKYCSNVCRYTHLKEHPIRYWLGKIIPDEMREKISLTKKGSIPWNEGKSCSDETKLKISMSKKGKHIWNGKRENMEWITGENNKLWKGSNVGYVSLHTWLVRNYGKACKCEFCYTLDAKRYEWSNKSGEYKRDISDWMQLCTKCHRSYDIKNIWGKAVEKYPERKRNANL